MLKNMLRGLLGLDQDIAGKVKKDLKAINALAGAMKALSDDAMKEKTSELQRRIDSGEKIDGKITHEAFALVREAADRVLGKRPYDVQIVGGLILNDCRIAEMRTGEGKTLTAAMPTYLNALKGKGVHIITVNDYLAYRDAETIGKVHAFLGLSVGVILAGMEDLPRRQAYACDITYGTNSEFGFDFLRDNLRFEVDQMVQRGHHYAVVDEVDSILIDDARTPLIISAPFEDNGEVYTKVDRIISRLAKGTDYALDEKAKSVALTETGQDRVETMLRADGLLEADVPLYGPSTATMVHHVTAALRAHALFTRNADYVVAGGEVVIVDVGTGRKMTGRRFSDGIHQALEAKENVLVQREQSTLSSITYQNYFRLYDRLSGMTGTASTESGEFLEVYGLPIFTIPTHRPQLRIDEADEVHLTTAAKNRAIVEAVIEARGRMQPVLIGTSSVEKSDLMAKLLTQAGFTEGEFARIKDGELIFQVLNANNHEREADIIAQAAIPGAVTIATNMAGRGTDIELGGSSENFIKRATATIEDEAERTKLALYIDEKVVEARERVRAAGGLFVIGTERHESRRIDNQLRGRAGRQGDPGRSRFYVSFEDDLVRIFAGDTLGKTAKKLGLTEGDAIQHKLVSSLLERAQKKVEQKNYDIRKDVVKFDNVNSMQREAIHGYRKEIMTAGEVNDLVDTMREQALQKTIREAIPANAYAEQWDAKGLAKNIEALLDLKLPVEDWSKEDGVTEEVIFQRVWQAYDEREVDKAAAFDTGIYDIAKKSALLQSFDQHWREHLSALEELKSVIGFRSYAQREPIIEYRTDAFVMFEAMLENLAVEVTKRISFAASSKPQVGELTITADL
jgi:preprotein translocase subunit SecA